jgi:hypothetical protein
VLHFEESGDDAVLGHDVLKVRVVGNRQVGTHVRRSRLHVFPAGIGACPENATGVTVVLAPEVLEQRGLRGGGLAIELGFDEFPVGLCEGHSWGSRGAGEMASDAPTADPNGCDLEREALSL